MFNCFRKLSEEEKLVKYFKKQDKIYGTHNKTNDLLNKIKRKAHTCPNCKEYQNYKGYKKGFGLGKSIAGSIIFGPTGLLAGFIGTNKIYAICNNCSHKWLIKL